MKLWRYRDSQRPVKACARLARNFAPAWAFLLLAPASLPACSVDSTFEQDLEGTWTLSDGGFSCSTDPEIDSLESVTGGFDDITLELAGTEARITRTSGSCEEVFLFDADTSREGELRLRPSATVVCTGCDDESLPEDCDTVPEKTWNFTAAIEETEEQTDEETGETIAAETQLTLVTTDSDRGFGKSCTEFEVDDGDDDPDTTTYLTAPAQLVLNKN